MKLPADYFEIVRRGVDALRVIGLQYRVEADRHPESPELWLTVRDVEGLAGRLAEATEWEWQDGQGAAWIGGQDFGVLNELVEVDVKREHVMVGITGEQIRHLTRLRAFLREYCERAFDPDHP